MAIVVILAAGAAMVVAGPSIFPPQRESVAATPVGERTALFTTDDYPTSALRNSEQGLVEVEIGIAKSGAVDRCTISESSGSASLDSATCDVIERRAHYQPARDVEGEPMPGHDRIRIKWVIPKE